MGAKGASHLLIWMSCVGVSGCGMTVPEMRAFAPDRLDPTSSINSTEGEFESDLIWHIRCSIGEGLARIRNQNA